MTREMTVGDRWIGDSSGLMLEEAVDDRA